MMVAFLLVADRVEPGAHIFKWIRQVGAGLAIDAHAHPDAGLQISGDIRHPDASRPFESGFQDIATPAFALSARMKLLV